MPHPILVAKAKSEIFLLPQFANRHGLIAGATGTGKTVTLQRLAEGFSRIGVPVFMADVKGDLAGLSQAGEPKGKIKERIGRLSNRVQHALRAFTPRDQKAVKAAATTLRANPKLNVETAITELGVGEALVSLFDEKGRPTVVQRAFVVPPGSRLGPVTPQEREQIIKSSLLAGAYDKVEDRESAYEKLTQRVSESVSVSKPAGTPAQQGPAAGGGLLDALGGFLGGSTGPRGGRREGAIEAAATSAARSIGAQVGQEIVRGVLGSIFGGGRHR